MTDLEPIVVVWRSRDSTNPTGVIGHHVKRGADGEPRVDGPPSRSAEIALGV